MELTEVGKQIATWENAQRKYVQARAEYRRAWAEAYVVAEAKTDTARKAAADIATHALRIARDLAEASAAAEWQTLLALRGSLEGSRQPGYHKEDAA